MKDISLKDRNGVSNERLVNKVQDLIWDDVFAQYIGDPLLLDYVENFTGPNVTAMHTMLINKPPDSGKMTSRHPWHQVSGSCFVILCYCKIPFMNTRTNIPYNFKMKLLSDFGPSNYCYN